MASLRNAVVVAPGEGLQLWSMSDRFTFKVRSSHTAGDFMLAEIDIAPGGGTPPHIHLREDEMFYVFEGDVSFTLDDTTFCAPRGSGVFLRRGRAHAFANRTNRPARVLVWANSENFESFMLEFCVPVRAFETPPGMDATMTARLTRASEGHGLVMLPGHKAEWAVEPPPAPEPLAVLGTGAAVRLTSETTHGHMCLAELDVRAGTGVVPHRHRREDETFYVVSGDFEIEIDGVVHAAPRGPTVYVPRGTFHAFHNVGCASGKLLSMHTPGGFEQFFHEMANWSAAGEEVPESDTLVKLMDMYGMDVPAELMAMA